MASTTFASRRHVGLLVDRSSWAAEAAVGEAGVRETMMGLDRLGLRSRLYELDGAATGTEVAPRRIAEFTASHARALALTPLRYLATLGRAALRKRAGWAEFGAAVRLASTLRRDGIAHLHACDPVSASLAETVARLTGMRFSMAASVTLDESMQRPLAAAHFALLPTDAALRAARAIAPRATVHRAYPGVDHRHYCPKLRSRPASVPLLLAVGEPRTKWDLTPLIEACRRMAQSGITLRCEVVGAAPDLPRLQSHVDRCGLRDLMRLVGPLSESRLMERYARAAIFVQVAHVTPQGSVAGIPTGLLEAMAMGLPVIATRSPATEECVTHASSGWLVPGDDAAQLFDAIRRLLIEPRLGENLGKQARETIVGRFDRDANLRALQQLLEEALRAAALAPIHASEAVHDTQATQGTGFRLSTAPNRRASPELHHA